MSDCYWMSGGRCYFEHLLENDHEGLIIDIIREVPQARQDILDDDKCTECEFPERFVEEAREPSPPLPREVRLERFQKREWARNQPPTEERYASNPTGPVISNEDLRERQEYRDKVQEDNG